VKHMVVKPGEGVTITPPPTPGASTPANILVVPAPEQTSRIKIAIHADKAVLISDPHPIVAE